MLIFDVFIIDDVFKNKQMTQLEHFGIIRQKIKIKRGDTYLFLEALINKKI